MGSRQVSLFEDIDHPQIHVVRGLMWLRKDLLDPGVAEELRAQLHIVGEARGKFGEAPEAQMWIETENLFGVPRFFGFKRFGFFPPDQVISGNSVRWDHQTIIKFRDGQEEVFEKTYRALLVEYGGILQAGTGFGKTVLGIQIAKALGFRTMVLVQSTVIQDQWVQRIQEFTGQQRVGVVKGDTCEFKDCGFVVATVQSLCARGIASPDNPKGYPSDLFEGIGLLVADEAHRLSATLWNESVTFFPATYRLGLTATPTRSDGMGIVFRYHLGRILARGDKTANQQLPEVWMVKTSITKDQLPKTKKGWRVNVKNEAQLLTSLSNCEPRNQLLLKVILKAVNKGRKIIGFSHRVDQCKWMARALRDHGVDAQEFLGVMKKDSVKTALEADVIVATYKKAAEGLDVSRLDMGIWLTPTSSVKQPGGRLLREHPGKRQPIIVDPVDGLGMAGEWEMRRRRQYKAYGWKVHETG